MGSLIDCHQQPGRTEKCRDNFEMETVSCPVEFKFPYDYDRRCCADEVKDGNPGPGCQNTDDPSLRYDDHEDCCLESTQCPGQN